MGELVEVIKVGFSSNVFWRAKDCVDLRERMGVRCMRIAGNGSQNRVLTPSSTHQQSDQPVYSTQNAPSKEQQGRPRRRASA